MLYLAAHWQTAFYEVFGEDLLDQLPEDRAITSKVLETRQWVEFEITEEIQAFDVTDSKCQREIGADGSTFRVNYDVTQPWSAALRKNAAIEAIQYVSRLDDPRLCLGVYALPKFVSQGEALFFARAGKKLSEDADFLFWLLHSEKITVK